MKYALAIFATLAVFSAAFGFVALSTGQHETHYRLSDGQTLILESDTAPKLYALNKDGVQIKEVVVVRDNRKVSEYLGICFGVFAILTMVLGIGQAVKREVGERIEEMKL